MNWIKSQENQRAQNNLHNTRVRMNREYMNQPATDKETLKLWNNQPAIYFDLGENK